MNILISLAIGAMIISITGFGGGPAMLANIYAVFVETNLISNEAYNSFVTISFSLPGGQSLKMISLIGYEMAGLLGYFIALGAYLIPSTTIMTFNDQVVNKFGKQLKILGKYFPLLISAILLNLMITMTTDNVKDLNGMIIILCLCKAKKIIRVRLEEKISSPNLTRR